MAQIYAWFGILTHALGFRPRRAPAVGRANYRRAGIGWTRGPRPATATVRGESVERSNVDPTTELAALMETQRQLEANANMIHTQDSTLQLLVNNVGKIS